MPLADNELEKLDIEKILLERPFLDDYYLTIAFVIAQKSFDPSSKCGCVIVSKDNRILSAGYNGPIKHSIDKDIPLTRPQKYCHMIHGEENALLAYNGSYQDIQGATAYVTGRPCHRCLRMLIQKGILKIVYGPNVTKVIDQADMDAQIIMLRHHPEVILVELGHNNNIIGLLKKTINYIDMKVKMSKNYKI